MLRAFTPLFSLLFRFSVFVYLRVIPVHRVARFVLPTLYSLYLATTVFSAPPKAERVVAAKKIRVIDVVDTKTNEVIEETVQVVDTAVVVEPANGRVKELPAVPASSNGLIDTLGSLLFSFPTKSWTGTVGIAINTLLLLMSIDFAYRPTLTSYDPTFTRVGAVDHSSAKIVVRYPGLPEDQLRIVWQRVHSVLPHSDVWKEGPVLDIEEEKDWTASGKIANLWPSAEYVYRLAYLNSTLLPYPETPIAFKTFPDPKSSAGTHFKFLISSCMMPNFPYNPAFPERIKGMDILSDYLTSLQPAAPKVTPSHAQSPADPVEEAESVVSEASTPVASATATPITELPGFQTFLAPSEPRKLSPEFMIMAGDAIYADVPHYAGDDVETYRKLYRRSFASPSYRKVYEKLPIFGIYDDHEIINNFAGENDENKAPFANASNAFKSYYGDANPEPHQSDVSYYDFRYGDNAFFVLDTRRYRSVPNADSEESVLPPTMLGDKQLHALHSWLGKVNTTTTFKFIVSSVPFTTLWHGFDGQRETWAAYKFERDSLFDVLQYVPNVVLLSGDRHEFAFIEHRGKIPEISVSPLSMFAVNSMTLRSRSEATIEKTYVDTIHTCYCY
ncbi:hypothetical protein M408DRAFT_16053 [Serendipita vermifera MAFF 305830]|uniref:PhoD-like phosphatase metallophosphatase domain-containing protein n=1 Tax=Serendipita vermifera MAFF 305830 TaxID=933852 RepID=A0A0C2WSC2_SERVB|nr:hypothetical protein M408DRAFT_16053 [Serendipita vermifera MAFF 305830]